MYTNVNMNAAVRPGMNPSWNMWSPPWMTKAPHWSAGVSGAFNGAMEHGSLGARRVDAMVDEVRSNGWRLEDIRLLEGLVQTRPQMFSDTGKSRINSFFWKVAEGNWVEMGEVDDSAFSGILGAMSMATIGERGALEELDAELIVSAVDARKWRFADMASVVLFLSKNHEVFNREGLARLADFLTVASNMEAMRPVVGARSIRGAVLSSADEQKRPVAAAAGDGLSLTGTAQSFFLSAVADVSRRSR